MKSFTIKKKKILSKSSLRNQRIQRSNSIMLVKKAFPPNHIRTLLTSHRRNPISADHSILITLFVNANALAWPWSTGSVHFSRVHLPERIATADN